MKRVKKRWYIEYPELNAVSKLKLRDNQSQEKTRYK